MKRFWLVLLSLGLIVAFSTSAMAVDLKFSGEYYAAGMYMDKTDLKADVGSSTAFYFQRLRLNTTFVVHPGLFLTTRADIMERAWGATRTAPAGGAGALQGFAANVQSAGTQAENENIAFDLCYATYISPIGMFMAGYQIDGAWGTVFGDNSIPTGKISYILRTSGVTLIAQMGKNSLGVLGGGGENSRPYGGVLSKVDGDSNFYTLAAKYTWKTGDAGFLFKYVDQAALRTIMPAKMNIFVLAPYAKAQLGPVALQAEIMYVFGKSRNWDESVNADDQRLDVLNGWVDATADFDKFYVGGSLAYLRGQDNSRTDAMTQGVIDGGFDWNPCLIMFNSERTQWVGGLAGYGTANATTMSNAFFGQLRGGVRPVDKLDIMASVSYAKAERNPGFDSRDYGYEIDLTATYKITNNLSYMLGGGYWVVGDYYQGATTTANDLDNEFMVINKLTLTF